MSIDTMSPAIIAGWYPDPADDNSARWWDGNGWTANVRPIHPVAPTAVSAFPPVPIRTEATLPPIDPYRPMDKRRDAETFVSMAAQHRLTLTPTRTYTASVWWLATMPLWWTVLQVALLIGLGEFYTTFLQFFVAVFVLLIAAALTMHDRKVLLAEAHPTAASAWWFLLSPLAYLIARSVHVYRSMKRGWAPVVLYIVCSFVPVIVAFTIGFLIAFAFALLG